MADLIIQEIYAAGSAPGGQQTGVPTYQYDYVVLHNTTGSAIDLTSYALQTINGTGTGTWTVLDLTGGTVPAFGYFLIQLGTTASSLGGAALPVTPDATGGDTSALGPNSAKVAITNTTTALTGAVSSGATIVDMVGFGTQANAREGSSSANNAPSPTNTTSIVRNPADGWDTNINSADFASGTPAPKNSSSPPLNSTPSVTSAATATFAENATGTVLDVNAFDPEGNTENGGGLTYSIVANASDDSALFTIDTNTGALSFITPPDAEAGTGHGATSNDYVLRVQVLDSGGTLAALGTQDVTITVTNVSPETIIGTSAANRLTGGSDKDILRGLSGNDVLDGAANSDTLTGGNGRDIMTGGTSADTFDFDFLSEMGKTSTTRDRISDFKHLYDKIDLSGVDAKTGVDGNQAFTFLAAKGAAFTGVKGQLHWFQIDSTNPAFDKTIIEGDVNGDKRADFQIELTGLKLLSKSDFIL